MELTLQLHFSQSSVGWIDVARAYFRNEQEVSIDYNLEYVANYLERKDMTALSLQFPVQITPYRGKVPGFLIDLIPQGPALRRILQRHQIARDTDYYSILAQVPLASPGNIRIKEAWENIEQERLSYCHEGFKRFDIIEHREDFIEYMEEHGAPIGGTSGVAGGAPKFLLRQDFKDKFHADGCLDDDHTKQAYLVKFPFTDSDNSKLLVQTEKAYYDLLRQSSLKCGDSIEIENDTLFIKRFDRLRRSDKRLHYLGLESFYSAHGIANFGSPLTHEDNLRLIQKYSSAFEQDILEYLLRDLVNELLSNVDNHGRNSSFIKDENSITLSPVYDVTAMKFFKGDFITRLTRWSHSECQALRTRLQWIAKEYKISHENLYEAFRSFKNNFLADVTDRLQACDVPEAIIKLSKNDRLRILDDVKFLG